MDDAGHGVLYCGGAGGVVIVLVVVIIGVVQSGCQGTSP